MYKLKLIIIGRTSNSLEAKNNLTNFLKSNQKEFKDCKVEVIDILKNPQVAETEKIVATPTLIRKNPTPEKRMVGNISRTDELGDFIRV